MATKKKTKKKTKSRVNEAGNYTKPTMRKRLFSKIKAGTKGGKAGQWSARKAQMLAKQYKSKDGVNKNGELLVEKNHLRLEKYMHLLLLLKN